MEENVFVDADFWIFVLFKYRIWVYYPYRLLSVTRYETYRTFFCELLPRCYPRLGVGVAGIDTTMIRRCFS